MFGQQNNNQPDAAQIPDQSINGVLDDQIVAQAAASAWQHPGVPLDGTAAPASVTPMSDDAATPVSVHDDAVSDLPNDLIDIKQQALSQLAPLVSHLDQSPEERFRTTMMMIQASDDQALVKDAYAAAQAITDEKIRAQALLDIVNEINYFTQHSE